MMHPVGSQLPQKTPSEAAGVCLKRQSGPLAASQRKSSQIAEPVNRASEDFGSERDPSCFDCIVSGLRGRWTFALPPHIGIYHDWGYRPHALDGRRAIGENEEGQRDNLYRYCHMVEPWWAIRNALDDVPDQVNGWSCGIVSSARFLAMVGWPVADYIRYHNNAPTTAAMHAQIGSGPQRLWDYMRKGGHLSGANIGLDMTHDWDTQQTRLNESIRLHRPMLVFFEVKDRVLHWAVVVGRDGREPFDYLMLETDGCIRWMAADELRKRMDLREHIGQHPAAQFNPLISFERFARFNSISCTWGDMRTNYHDIRTYAAHGRKDHLCGNKSAVNNVVNTLFDSPVAMATGVGLLWRLF